MRLLQDIAKSRLFPPSQRLGKIYFLNACRRIYSQESKPNDHALLLSIACAAYKGTFTSIRCFALTIGIDVTSLPVDVGEVWDWSCSPEPHKWTYLIQKNCTWTYDIFSAWKDCPRLRKISIVWVTWKVTLIKARQAIGQSELSPYVFVFDRELLK